MICVGDEVEILVMVLVKIYGVVVVDDIVNIM